MLSCVFDTLCIFRISGSKTYIPMYVGGELQYYTFANITVGGGIDTMINEELPDGVYEDTNGKYFRLEPSKMSREDELLFVQLRQMKYLKTIRNCVIFFVVLAVIGILLMLPQL